jgi:hypothetical protein
MAKKDVKLTEEELGKLQNLQKEYTILKMQLGDSVLQQWQICKKTDEVRGAFAAEEGPLMEKYGKNATINLETGDVTEKEEETKLEVTK